MLPARADLRFMERIFLPMILILTLQPYPGLVRVHGVAGGRRSLGSSIQITWAQPQASSGSPPIFSHPAIAAWDGTIYVCGGSFASGSTHLHGYAVASGVWSNLSLPSSGTPPDAIMTPTMAAWDGVLYVFGGGPYPGAFVGRHLHRYTVASRAWSNLSSTSSGSPPSSRAAHAMCALDGVIYVFGGMADSEYQNDLHGYTVASGIWSDLSSSSSGSPPGARIFHRMAALDGVIYVFGGDAFGTPQADAPSLHGYTVASGAWSDLSSPLSGSPPSPRSQHGMAALDGVLYVLGGLSHDSDLDLNDLHGYTVVSGAWSTLSSTSSGSPQSARGLHAMAALDDALYFVWNTADQTLDIHSFTPEWVCNKGWNGDGETCFNVDECNDNSNNCDANAACTDSDGSFTCECNSGWASSDAGVSCIDVIECGSTDNCDANAACTDSDGSFTCECNSGWASSDAGVTCIDVIECGSTDNCDANAACTDSDGSFTCECNSGWASSDAGVTCIDVIECGSTDNCDANAACTDSDGSFTCECNSGWASSDAGVTCIRVDVIECGSTDNCDANAACTDSDGSFTCECNSGWASSDAGVTCIDVIECGSTDNCDANAACTDSDGSFTCECNSGWASSDAGVTCIDVIECGSTDNCDANAACTDSDGSFTCECNSGWASSDAGVSCIDVIECGSTDNCDANAACTDSDGSFTCECNSGYRMSGETCIDDNECVAGTHNCIGNATCTNEPGSFACECRSGFMTMDQSVTCEEEAIVEFTAILQIALEEFDAAMQAIFIATVVSVADITSDDVSIRTPTMLREQSAEGRRLLIIGITVPTTIVVGAYRAESVKGVLVTDLGEALADKGIVLSSVLMHIDECFDGSHSCDKSATCSDTDGSFTCACKAGYIGDGKSCADRDECTLGTNNCDSSNAQCANTDGSFTCVCNSGWVSSDFGVTCSNVFECGATDNCDTNAACTDSQGSFACVCNSGWSSSDAGVTCRENSSRGFSPVVVGAVASSGGLALVCAVSASWIWLRKRRTFQRLTGQPYAASLASGLATTELSVQIPIVVDESGGMMPGADSERANWREADKIGWKSGEAGPTGQPGVDPEDAFAPSAPPLQDLSVSLSESAPRQHSLAVPFIDYGEVTVLHHLTSGSFKAVCKAQWCPAGEEPRTVALLVLRVGSVDAEKATFEKLGRHPYLTQLFAMTKNEAGQECLLTEYAEHGSLDVYLQQKQDGGVVVTSEVLLTAATQICDGMAQLAMYNVIHRDLAARNVLVFQMHPADHRLVIVKITDYGLAVHGSSVSTISTRGGEAGPLRWMAPESIARRRYTQQSDVFAFGVTMWEMWSMGAIPWDIFSDAEAAQLVKQGQRPAKPEGCPDEVYTVMKLCWTDNPVRRPPFLQLRTHLQDALKRVSAEEQGPTCVICLMRDPSVALFPCCHRCLCESPDCKQAIQGTCPICRTKVDAMRQIYDP